MDPRITSVVLLDPWMWPLGRESTEAGVPCPTLVLEAPEFLWNRDIFCVTNGEMSSLLCAATAPQAVRAGHGGHEDLAAPAEASSYDGFGTDAGETIAASGDKCGGGGGGGGGGGTQDSGSGGSGGGGGGERGRGSILPHSDTCQSVVTGAGSGRHEWQDDRGGGKKTGVEGVAGEECVEAGYTETASALGMGTVRIGTVAELGSPQRVGMSIKIPDSPSCGGWGSGSDSLRRRSLDSSRQLGTSQQISGARWAGGGGVVAGHVSGSVEGFAGVGFYSEDGHYATSSPPGSPTSARRGALSRPQHPRSASSDNLEGFFTSPGLGGSSGDWGQPSGDRSTDAARGATGTGTGAGSGTSPISPWGAGGGSGGGMPPRHPRSSRLGSSGGGGGSGKP